MKVKRFSMLFGMGLFLLFLSCGDEERADTPEEPAEEVGVVTYEIQDISRDKVITIEIWYPAVAEPGASGEMYLGGVQGIAVREAVPDPKYAPYPLIVFSHGLGSFRSQSIFLTESLAKQRYVVAAPDHSDAGALMGGDFSEIDADMLTDRPQDISFLIDELLARSAGDDPILKGLVDESRIGVTGHSMGGYTSIAVAGAEFNLEYLKEQCKTETLVACNFIDEVPPGLGEFNLRDQRVIASLPMAPASSTFGPEGISEIDIPMMVMGGTIDTLCPFATEQEPLYQALNSPKYLLEIFEAGHMVFSDSTCLLLPNLPECQIADELQSIMVSHATAFFGFHVKGIEGLSSELQEKTTDDYELSAER
ncbi:MAG: hypothetical protein JSU92_09630 [Deltaproteobacteria bacterium]|nr:MAG: hypothetical protein JSU92_09630 [Deltaproteobacteria bacterium]